MTKDTRILKLVFRRANKKANGALTFRPWVRELAESDSDDAPLAKGWLSRAKGGKGKPRRIKPSRRSVRLSAIRA